MGKTRKRIKRNRRTDSSHYIADPNGSGRTIKYSFEPDTTERLRSLIETEPDHPLLKLMHKEIVKHAKYLEVLHDCIINKKQIPQDVFNYIYENIQAN